MHWLGNSTVTIAHHNSNGSIINTIQSTLKESTILKQEKKREKRENREVGW